MEQLNLNTQTLYRENSEAPKIVSPSPMRSPFAKMNLLIAGEILHLSNPADELDTNGSLGHVSPFLRRNLSSWFRGEDEFINDLRCDSSLSNSPHSSCELSKSNSSRSSHTTEFFEDMFPEIIPRASNPIVKDANFRKHNKESFKFGHGSETILRCQ